MNKTDKWLVCLLVVSMFIMFIMAGIFGYYYMEDNGDLMFINSITK